MPRPLLSGKLITEGVAQHTAGYIDPIAGSKAEGTLINVAFGAGTSTGVVLIEDAPFPEYDGTWAVIATVTWSAVSKSHEAFIAGSFLARRARISTAVTGGVVDVYFLVTG